MQKKIKNIYLASTKLNTKENILIVAAHPDDEILGCGGSIIKLKNNCTINTIFMTNGVSSRKGASKKHILRRKTQCLKLFKHLKINKPIFFNLPDNQMDKIPILKIVKRLEKYIKLLKPSTIFTHYENCLNVDHKKTFEAVITACRPINNHPIKKILSFEIPSSTEWNVGKKNIFVPNYFVDITNVINKKIESIKFYKDEIRKYPHSRSLKLIKSLASYRGASSGVRYAEAFYLNRFIDK